jgi:hypothetical protein
MAVLQKAIMQCVSTPAAWTVALGSDGIVRVAIFS